MNCPSDQELKAFSDAVIGPGGLRGRFPEIQKHIRQCAQCENKIRPVIEGEMIKGFDSFLAKNPKWDKNRNQKQ